MSLIKKLTSKKKEEKRENYFNFFLNEQNSELKKLIKELSIFRRRDQKKHREKVINLILKKLTEIENLYKGFLGDLSNLNQKNTKTKNSGEVAEFMDEKKKSLRCEFESIYINFKKTAMGLEDVPMKMILKKMQSAFNFDGKIHNQAYQHPHKYYGTNTDSLRNLII